MRRNSPSFEVEIEPPLKYAEKDIGKDVEAIKRGVTKGISRSTLLLKRAWRTQIVSAGLGRRLANTIRGNPYPDPKSGEYSLEAAGYVYSRAPEIIIGHDEGSIIRAVNRKYLAIPLPAAGKAPRGMKMTPERWRKYRRTTLRPVWMQGQLYLVADNARLTKRGQARLNRRKRRKDYIKTGEVTVPVFLLLPQAKLRKKTDLMTDAERVSRVTPAIVAKAVERELRKARRAAGK